MMILMDIQLAAATATTMTAQYILTLRNYVMDWIIIVMILSMRRYVMKILTKIATR